MSRPLEDVEQYLVTPVNPPRDLDGMDYERCAALHNAIYEHGWIGSGRTAADFLAESRLWLDSHPAAADDPGCHASLIEFLRRARTLPSNHEIQFAYQAWGLDVSLGEHDYAFPDDDQTVTLYQSYMSQCSKPDGLVYDQGTHRAIIHLDITDELTPEQPWVPLECILTVWIEMIRRGKVVALPANVGSEKYEKSEDGIFRMIKGPTTDPATGAKRLTGDTNPWTIVPWAPQDLADALELWDELVQTVETKMGLEDHQPESGLLQQETLSRVRTPEGFALKFLMQARLPRFKHIAPGLELPQDVNFDQSPFLDEISDDINLPPILLFRSDTDLPANQLSWSRYRPSTPRLRYPCGLYLDSCDREYAYPQEDGIKLVLPFELEGEAKQSDLSPAHGHENLLQSGLDPYNIGHAAPFQAFLETAIANIDKGHWSVDAEGVAGGIEKWRDADTEENWRNYFIEHGPGGLW
ncbi:hypothetical protein LTR62_003116 [Meristemomyces frigidus]|uniref:Uncharacterized protein n=1 Tax=Meristemomyces frigidus TaxID=1508187 RepID=A0AAN7TFD9_9PEZI|nr:hypothetical protein LTR62_003116 [Meristemomyces frigidus]